MWIILVSINKENYLRIQDIKKSKEKWDILVDVHSNLYNARYSKQKLPKK